MKQWCLNGLENNIIEINKKTKLDMEKEYWWPNEALYIALASEKGSHVLKAMWNKSTKKKVRVIKILSKLGKQVAKKSLKKIYK